jgi:tripartite-type tricarboxylate transporter receptor subunit TctC
MRTLFVVSVIATLASIVAAVADGYPSKPITFVVPFAAGGPLDSLARGISEPMSADLGQPIIIENVTGAAGSIGVGRVAHAAPDGYTVSVGNWSTHVLNGAIHTLPYDLLNDLAPVALLPSAPQLIVAKSALPAANFRELVAWLQSNKANVGTAGVGSATHVSGLLFQDAAKSQFAFVSYRSAGAALQDLVAGISI